MNKKRITILGGGESGVGAALLAQRKNCEVFLSDSHSLQQRYRLELMQHQIVFEENGHTKKIYHCDLAVKSPGIPDNAPLISPFIQQNTEVISEIEFAYRHCNKKIIAVTGSNGKTTTTSLIGHILKSSLTDVAIAGNIGVSFSRALLEPKSIYVLEISSFQLDGIKYFRPDIAIITNITPDHLDRYNNQFENYVASKMRITMNQLPEDHLIVCAEDESTTHEIDSSRAIHARLHRYSLGNEPYSAAYIENNHLIIHIKEKEIIMTLEELALQGRHNIYNSMAAGIAAKLIDIRKENIKQCLSDFQNIPHRLEKVATIHGVTFINDSKATNVNSAWFALESQNMPVVWIAGGVDKGNDYTRLKELVKARVTVLICLGTENEKLKNAFSGDVDIIEEANTMDQAVRIAYHVARPGETVLLSPACASFDLFENYEDRGNQFKTAVNKL
ncbi:MAG: UDP-N-acetylmuramoyl-L-alanine--D-glutamate ligase [Bacteroidales bacterium]|nr:UDP-N-acetylmuramoyl-L-alanine--D-glutamate ligase [Bacteroidales bacterium]MDD3009859.1 UDP-N-acetylmuramoyl-L-alanine--D-glutamate ligase [Bacteroidales bacterium]MDD3960925.1 UDP-N-acetylmuramoyl-L-alanine--D-glutamate ligase [Bacteroidales bacterium]HPE85702.1 UDP-N-acetylmuramoyl-L-alanine--D-glutamate ligase [Bacteroidales bacterium]